MPVRESTRTRGNGGRRERVGAGEGRRAAGWRGERLIQTDVYPTVRRVERAAPRGGLVVLLLRCWLLLGGRWGGQGTPRGRARDPAAAPARYVVRNRTLGRATLASAALRQRHRQGTGPGGAGRRRSPYVFPDTLSHLPRARRRGLVGARRGRGSVDPAPAPPPTALAAERHRSLRTQHIDRRHRGTGATEL